jgi:hypothetical protein
MKLAGRDSIADPVPVTDLGKIGYCGTASAAAGVPATKIKLARNASPEKKSLGNQENPRVKSLSPFEGKP